MAWHLHIAECLIWTLHFFDLRKILHYLSLLFEVCIPCSLFLLLTLRSMRSKYAFLTPRSKHSEPPKAKSRYKSFLPRDTFFAPYTPAPCLYQTRPASLESFHDNAYVTFKLNRDAHSHHFCLAQLTQFLSARSIKTSPKVATSSHRSEHLPAFSARSLCEFK